MDVLSRPFMGIGNINVADAIRNVQQLMEKEKMSPAMRAALKVILMLVELLVNKIGLNSKNSSTPPSFDPNRKKTPKQKSERKPGGQEGHVGKTLGKRANPDKIKEILVDRTTLPIGNWKVSGYESRQVFDIDISVVVTEYRAEVLMNDYGERYTAKFPDGVVSPTQYGDSVRAHAVYLSQHQMIPFARLQEYFAHQLNLPLSAGSLDNFNLKAYEKLDWYPEFVKKQLLGRSVLYTDETGINTNGKRNWVHVVADPLWTYLFPHAKRGREAIDAMGTLSSYRGILCHDHWKPYFKFEDIIHALCNAHHLRELERAYEKENQQWAPKMSDLLLAMNKAKIGNDGIVPPEQAMKFRQQYRELIAEAEKECPEPIKSEGKRGRLKRSKARNLLERLRDFEDATLMFMYIKELGFTNNESERALRMLKVQQKISGCFKSFQGAKVHCRINSYLASATKQGFSASYALKAMFEGRNIFLENEKG